MSCKSGVVSRRWSADARNVAVGVGRGEKSFSDPTLRSSSTSINHVQLAEGKGILKEAKGVRAESKEKSASCTSDSSASIIRL